MPVFTELPNHQIEMLALRLALLGKSTSEGGLLFLAPRNIEIMEFLTKEDIQISRIKKLVNADAGLMQNQLQFLMSELIQRFRDKRLIKKFFDDFGKAMVSQDNGEVLTNLCKNAINPLLRRRKEEIKTIMLRLSVDFRIVLWLSKDSKEKTQSRLTQLLASYPASDKLERRVLERLDENESNLDLSKLIESKDDFTISALLQNEAWGCFQIESMGVDDVKLKIEIKNISRMPIGRFEFQGVVFDFSKDKIEVSFNGKRKVFRSDEKARMLRELFQNKNKRVEISSLRERLNKDTLKEVMDIMDRIKRELKTSVGIPKDIVDIILPPAKDSTYRIVV